MMNFADPTDSESNAFNQQVLHPGSRTLFRYWESLRAERPYPARGEMNLRDLTGLLPSLFVLERDAARTAFKFRLAGTLIDQMHARPVTGADALEGWDNFERGVISKVLNTALERYQPGLVRMRLFTGFQEVIGAELIALPVRGMDTGTVQLFGGMFPFTDPARIIVDRVVSRQLITSRTIWTEHGQGDGRPDSGVRPTLRVIPGGRSG